MMRAGNVERVDLGMADDCFPDDMFFFSGDIYFALTIRYINWNDTVLENMSRICIEAY